MKKLDTILVVDVESTCWDKGEQPKGQVSEIIEIGMYQYYPNISPAKGTPQKNIDYWDGIYQTSIIVKPTLSTISDFSKELNGICYADIDEKGIPFADACQKLVAEFDSKHRVWASYGDYDRKQFQRDCTAKSVAYPFGDSHINVKTLFALKYGLDHEVGMAEALKLLGLPLEGRHHSGVDDAKNITKILAWVLGK